MWSTKKQRRRRWDQKNIRRKNYVGSYVGQLYFNCGCCRARHRRSHFLIQICKSRGQEIVPCQVYKKDLPQEKIQARKAVVVLDFDIPADLQKRLSHHDAGGGVQRQLLFLPAI